MKHLSLFLSLFYTISIYANDQPNIILIMADDVSWTSFGSYGAEDYKTPNLDKMASQGAQFKHCYSTPICTTSRVMLMTGKYNFRNYTHFGHLDPTEKTFGHLMQEAGYNTAIAGKWQLNGLYSKNPEYDDPERPYKAGFDEYCLWQVTRMKNAGERFWSPPIETNGEFQSAEQNQGKYGPDIFTDFVTSFMEKSVEKEEPFFIYYPMVLVHDPFVATPDTIGDANRSQKANKEVKSEAKIHFQSMVNYMDKIVGRIVAKTEALGVNDNTLIIFTSDNGTSGRLSSRWKGKNIQGGKGTMTDMGTHVPMIISWNGIAQSGVQLEDPIDFADIYPTLAEAAGRPLNKSDPSDGFSLLPLLKGQRSHTRKTVFCHYQPYWRKKPGQFARTAQYKLYNDGRFYEPAKDLKEQHNLTEQNQSEEQKQVYQHLKSVLKQAPPAPKTPGDRNTKTSDRQTHPLWPKLPLNQ